MGRNWHTSLLVFMCVVHGLVDTLARNSSFLPHDYKQDLRRRRLDASEYWSKTVPEALRGGAPKAGSATLLFVHVPKTAGSSMERVLERVVDMRSPVCMRRFMASDPVPDGNGWAPVTLLQAYPENDPEGPCDNKRGDLIYGHFPLDAFGAATHWIERSGELDKMLVDGGFTNQGGGSEGAPRDRLFALKQQPAELARLFGVYPVIMLRDPLERVVSFANFLNMEQPAFEAHPERLSCNQQTSMVNGVPGCGGGCGAGVPAGNEDKWKGSYVQFRGSCNHDQTGAVQEAKRRLEELFFFVGVTEDFASSMFLLQRSFGWGESSVLMAFEKSMKSFCDGTCRKRFKVKDLMPSTVTAIRTNEERCDKHVWLHAKELLESRMAAMSPEDRSAFQAFQAVAAEHEKMGDKVRIAANRRGRPVNTRKTHGVLKVATLTEATNRVQEKRQQQLQHKKPPHLATPQASAAAGSSSEAHIKMAAAFASAAAAGALSDGGGLYTRDDVGSESSESGAKSGGGVGAGNKQLSPSEDFNKVRRKEAAAKTASEKGLVQGGHHWGVCGSNAVLEEHSTEPHHGDLCRMADGGVYCPIGCEHVPGKPHCASNSGDNTDPCRYRNITRAFHVRDQIRGIVIPSSDTVAADLREGGHYERRKQEKAKQSGQESHRAGES